MCLCLAATEVTIVQLQTGELHKAKRQKIVKREEKIKLLKDELTNGNRTINLYISAIRHYCVIWFLGMLIEITQPKVYKLNQYCIEYNIESAMCYGVISSWMKINNCNSITF